MARTKAKAPAAPAAQTVGEVTDLVARIGVIQRELARQDADLGDVIAKAKEMAETKASPLKAELAEACARVQGFCEANRGLLTHDWRTKTVKFASGTVSWRARPAKVSLRGVEAVIERLRASKTLKKFLRVSVEIDKEAMLKDPTLARTITGVTIGSEGEDFTIEPLEAPLAATLPSTTVQA